MTNNDDFNHDDLNRRLSDLGGDLTPVRLPGAAAARNRAAQRSRHQVLGSVAAGVALVVGVIVFRAGVVPADNTEPIKSPSNTATITSPPASSDSTAISDDALMQASDIWDYEYGEADWRTVSPTGPELGCRPDLSGLGTLDEEGQEFAWPQDPGVGESADVGPDDPRMRQDLLLLEDGSGEDVFAQVQQRIRECVPDLELQDLAAGRIEGVGEQSWIIRFWDTTMSSDGEARAMVNIGVVQQDNMLSVTTGHWFINGDAGDPDRVTPANAADRACRAVFEATCVRGDPFFVPEVPDDDPTDPSSEPSGSQGTDAGGPTGTDGPNEPSLLELDDEPLLTNNDVNPVGTYDGFALQPTTGPSDVELQISCLTPFQSANAEFTAYGVWNQELGEGGFTEILRQMADIESAESLLDEHRNLPEQCGPKSEGRIQTVNQPVELNVEGADNALAWTVTSVPDPETDQGSEPSFGGIGMAQMGNIILVIRFGAFGDPTDGDWAGYAARTLAVALDRATG